MLKSQNVHVIVLAGDDDSGLNPLTRALTGTEVPKQFAFITGDSSLLQQTVASYAAVVPVENLVVVVASSYEDVARKQLQRWKGIGILARTLDRGAAVDTLLALGRVVARAPNVGVVVAPAYHFVPETEALTRALVGAARGAPAGLAVLAGAVPMSTQAADDGDRLGDRLIVPGRRIEGGLFSVSRIVERAAPALSRRLRARGALWDTSALAGRAVDLWRLGAHNLPAEAEMIASLWSGRTASLSAVEAVFRHMPTGRAESRLWQSTKDLAVLPVRGSGWSPWRSAEQVMDSIGDSPQLERLLSRIYRRQQSAERVRMTHGMQ